MNIRNLKIMATNYEVKEVEQISKYERLWGEINFPEQTIRIDKCLSEELKQEALLHEILHGVLAKLGYTEMNDDEQKVQSIASTLYLVLKENNMINVW